MKDKVVVITGSASGIGQSIAQLFVKEGAKVVAAVKINKRAVKLLPIFWDVELQRCSTVPIQQMLIP